jgi:hypothetical protein
MCLSILNDVFVRISIKFRSQPPGGINGTDTPCSSSVGDQINGTAKKDEIHGPVSRSPVDKQCSLTPLANMSSARCALGIGVLGGQLVALGMLEL